MGVSKTLAGLYTSPDNPAMPNLYDISGSSYIGTGQGVAPSGYGSEYDKLFSANPYRNLTYKESLWQKVLSSLGFRTDADRWKEDAQVNAAEYDAGIFSMMQQNEYNSPAAQASRMREAGQNPDLLGTGDVSEAAKPIEDPNGMSQNVGDEFAGAVNAVRSFAAGFSEVISGAQAIYKSFQDIGFQRLEMDEATARLAEDDVFRSLPAAGFNSDEEFHDWVAHQLDHFTEGSVDEFFSTRQIPRQMRKRYAQVYIRSLQNLPTEIARYKSKIERAKLRKEWSSLNESSLYDDTSDDALGLIVGPLVKLSDDVTRLDAEVAKLVAQNAQHEQNVVSSELENRGIEADIEGQRLDFLQQTDSGLIQGSKELYEMVVGQMIAKTQSEIINGLKHASENGDRFAKCLEYQMVLSKFYNWNPADALKSLDQSALDGFDALGSTGRSFGSIARMFMRK